MSTASPAARKEFTPFTAEERASFLAHRFGSTLDWSSAILVELGYPVEALRWFVDAVQGICKGKERRIAHATLATRTQRFKNAAQAKSLVKRAIAADREWARLKRCMIFDIESPKPGEMEGKDKRARTRYTDYLTPAAVWAQEAEHRAKKGDEARWKKDSKHQWATRREILEAAIRQLPSFESVEDMPPTTHPKESKLFTISEYVEQREAVLLAENRRIIGKLKDGDPVDADEIDARLHALEVYYARARKQMEQEYESARSALLAMRSTRCVRMMDFSDPLETAAGVDNILVSKGYAGDPLSKESLSGNDRAKGDAHDPLSAPLPEDFEEVVIGDCPEPDQPLTQLDCALSYAALGIPVFPTKANKSPYTARGFKDATTSPEAIRAWWREHPEAGIGIPTGKASGWLVLDRDDRHGGDASLSALVEQHGDLPSTQEAATPSGGAHYIFKYPASVTLGNSAGKLGKGLDTRGEGGYIIAPGCEGARRWVNALDPADAPAWMIEALLSEKHEPINTDRKVVHAMFGGTRRFGLGERNDGLRDVAAGRWRHGYAADAQELFEQMREVRDTRCEFVANDPPPSDAWLRDMVQRTVRKFSRGELQQEVTA